MSGGDLLGWSFLLRARASFRSFDLTGCVRSPPPVMALEATRWPSSIGGSFPYPTRLQLATAERERGKCEEHSR